MAVFSKSSLLTTIRFKLFSYYQRMTSKKASPFFFGTHGNHVAEPTVFLAGCQVLGIRQWTNRGGPCYWELPIFLERTTNNKKENNEQINIIAIRETGQRNGVKMMGPLRQGLREGFSGALTSNQDLKSRRTLPCPVRRGSRLQWRQGGRPWFSF